jgi:hypothetical protein
MKTAFASSALVALLVPVMTHMQPLAARAAQPQCENWVVHEPILVFEVSGYTLAAQVERALILYADGSMKLSQASSTGTGSCALGQTTPENARALQQMLAGAGGFLLCDDARQVTDVPLRTLTLMRGTQDARAHTFSYWLGDEDYAMVDALLENFISQQFPD